MLTYQGDLTSKEPDATYKVEFKESKRYFIELEGSGDDPLEDPFLILVGEGGEYVEDDNSGNDGAALIVFRPAKTQYYDISALAAAGSSLGSYTLTVKVDDYRDRFDGAARIGYLETDGVARKGRINEAGDVDVFEIRLVEGLSYNLRLDPGPKGLNEEGEPKNRVTDPKLTLLSASGKTFTSDDNSGRKDAAFIDYIPTRSGIHYLQAEAADDDKGTYLLLASIGRASYQDDTVRGTKSGDSISALSGKDEVSGREGNDRIWGANGNDLLQGGLGDDTIWAGQGRDRIFGGADNDTLRGEEGDDVVDGGAGNDAIYGGDGDDTIDGGSGSDHIEGEAGASLIRGGEGNDWLVGGNGNDTLKGGAGRDNIYGNAGADHIQGGSGGGYLTGDVGKDTIKGGDGRDTIYGGSGDDSIVGAADGDYLRGDEGKDTIKGGDGGDNIYGGNDNDLILGAADGDWLDGGKGKDTLKGGDSGDNLYGGGDDDKLIAGKGNDYLNGDNGDDVLDGGSGADGYDGGGGNDLFIFSKAGHSTSRLMDGIYRFDKPGDKAGDVIDLSAIDGDRTTAGRQSLVFDESGSGDTGTLWLENSTVQSDSSIFIYANLDADEEAELVIRFYNYEGRTASQYSENDFIF